MRKDLKERWDVLTELVVERKDGFNRLVEDLRVKSTYFTAPASPKYHCNWEEGLLEHSLNVAEHALKLKAVLCPEIKSESCVICGLFHDLGKGPIGAPYYLIKEPTPRQQEFGYVAFPKYEYNSNQGTYFTVPQKSVKIVSQYMHLSDEEYQAILIHDGMYVSGNQEYGLKESKLARILQYADNWSGLAVEGIDEKTEDGKGYKRVKKEW